MSPGNLYRYFPSKEALVAGIAERDRTEVAKQFASADLSHGLFAVLEGMARHHFAETDPEELLLCTEVMAEARRNPEIARISASFDADVRKWLGDLFRAAVARGDVPADVDIEGAVTMVMIIADGISWRRAVDPAFDAQAFIPVFMDITRHMLRAGTARIPDTEEPSS
jgi:TetR/AcrR family transcriptional regulator, repressor for uid operon